MKEGKSGLKICCWAESKILSSNQIAEFLKQLFLKKDEVNQTDMFTLHVNIDSGKVNCDLKVFGKVG